MILKDIKIGDEYVLRKMKVIEKNQRLYTFELLKVTDLLVRTEKWQESGEVEFEKDITAIQFENEEGERFEFEEFSDLIPADMKLNEVVAWHKKSSNYYTYDISLVGKRLQEMVGTL